MMAAERNPAHGSTAKKGSSDLAKPGRRLWLGHWPVLGTIWGAGLVTPSADAQTSNKPLEAGQARAQLLVRGAAAETHMPGDPPEHRIVYQLNQADPEIIEHILGSVGALIGKYADNVAIVVVAFGPGIHLLARRPQRPVPSVLQERATAQAKDYGVRFVACGNTLQGLGWTAADLLPWVQVEAVGAGVLMELQEQGYAYLAW